MNISVLRLHELTKAQLKAFGQWLRDQIRPDDESVGSDWACQGRQQPHFWGDKYITKMAWEQQGRDTDSMDIWVAFLDGKPVCTSWCVRGTYDHDLTLFITDSSYTSAERFEIADEMALFFVKAILDSGRADRNLISRFPENSEAAAYARLCGFEVTLLETTDIIKARPLAQAVAGLRDILEIVSKRVEARRG